MSPSGRNQKRKRTMAKKNLQLNITWRLFITHIYSINIYIYIYNYFISYFYYIFHVFYKLYYI
jgi:hypothetical protein